MDAVEMRGGVGPRSEIDIDRVGCAAGIDAAVDREQCSAVEGVEDILRRAITASGYHDAVGELCRVGMFAPEDMNDLVGDDAQPLITRGARRIDPDLTARDLDVEWAVQIGGGIELVARHGEPDVLALWRSELGRPVLLHGECDGDLRRREVGRAGLITKFYLPVPRQSHVQELHHEYGFAKELWGGAFGHAEEWRIGRESQQETVRKQLHVNARLGIGAQVGMRFLMEIGDQFGPRHGVWQLAVVNGS